jgi:hypothetical protein
MIGILNIRTCLILVFLTSIASGCKDEDRNRPQKIIEDNFLTLVDTFAYEHGSFRPEAPDPRTKVIDNPKYYPELSIFIDKKSENSKIAENEIHGFLKRENLDNKFNKLMYEKPTYFTFDTTFAKKIGRYNISFEPKKQKKIKYAGEVVFSNFKVSSDLGYFVVELSDGVYDSIGFIVLIEKRNGKWVVTKREPLYRT